MKLHFSAAGNWTGLFLMMLFETVFSQGAPTFPAFENFESEIQCYSVTCGKACPLIGKWSNDTLDDLDWASNRNSTPSPATGPAGDHTTPAGSGYYVYIESSCPGIGSPNKTGSLLSPVLDFTKLTTPRLDFWYHMAGSSMGTMHVDVSTDAGQNWSLDFVGSWTGDLDQWMMKTILLDTFAGMDSIQIRIRGITGTAELSDMAVDDIRVWQQVGIDLEAVGSLLPPHNCLAYDTHIVDVLIINAGQNSIPQGDTIWVTAPLQSGSAITEFLISPAGFSPGDTLVFTFSQKLSFGLPGNFNFWFQLELNGDSMSGNDYYFRQIRSHLSIDSLPYFEDMESAGQEWFMSGANSSWQPFFVFHDVINESASGTMTWMMGYDYAPIEDSYVGSPCFNLDSVCNPWVEARVWWHTESGFDGTSLQYSTDFGKSWNTLGSKNSGGVNWYNDNDIDAMPGGELTGWSGIGNKGSKAWVKARHSLAEVSGMKDVIFRFAFASDESKEYNGFAFDDFVVFDGAWVGELVNGCLGDTTWIGSSALDTNYTFLWSTGDTDDTIALTTAGQYWLEVNSGGGCIRRDTFQLIQVLPLAASFTMDTSNCPDIQFTGSAFGGPAEKWKWNFGNGWYSNSKSPVSNYTNAGNGTYLVEFIAINACGRDTANDSLQINCVVGTEEDFEANPGFLVYPNPFRDDLTVKTGIHLQNGTAITGALVNMNGKQAILPESRERNDDPLFFDTRDLPSGMYVLLLIAGTDIQSFRVIKN